MRSMILASGIALMAATAANAGGFAAPVVEVEPAPVVVPEAPTWQGAYVGAALGYAFNGDDRIGRNPPRDNIGTAEISGPNLSLRAGYRWQKDRWVVGPELSYTAANVKDDLKFGTDGKFRSEMNHALGLRLKTGYLAQPDLLVYGIAGYQKGDFTYTYNGKKIDYDADGWVIGLGVEKKVNDRMSVTGELEHNYFDNTRVDLGNNVISRATPEHTNLKVGLNFKF